MVKMIVTDSVYGDGFQAMICEALPYILSPDFVFNLDKIRPFFQDLNHQQAKLASKDSRIARLLIKIRQSDESQWGDEECVVRQDGNYSRDEDGSIVGGYLP